MDLNHNRPVALWRRAAFPTRLRLAMSIAPGVAPATFLIALQIGWATGYVTNPASLGVLSVLGATLGLALAYALGWGMCLPLMRYVEKRRRLTLPLVIGCALTLAIVLAGLVPLVTRSDPPLSLADGVAMGASFLALLAGPIVLAAVVFFAVAAHDPQEGRRPTSGCT